MSKYFVAAFFIALLQLFFPQGFVFSDGDFVASRTTSRDDCIDVWKKHGFMTEDYDGLNKHLHRSVDSGEVPGGAMLLMHDGDVIFRQAFGYGHIRRKIPFSIESRFFAASLSKPIIATLVVKLDAEGIVDLDQPLDETLPCVANLRSESGDLPASMPTLRQCLHHTAGFRGDEGPSTRPWLKWKHKGYSLSEVVEKESMIPLAANPGTRYAYSGIGYDFVGRVIELATGQALESALQKYLCEPLGMIDTTFYPDEQTQNDMPSFYWRHRSDGSFRRRIDQPNVRPDDYTSVGGGIVTTIDNLAKFLQVHLNGGLIHGVRWIDEASLNQMYVRKKPGSFYGLGFVLGPADENGLASWILHTGSSGTMFWCDRQRKVVGVIATQQRLSDGTAMPESDRSIPLDTPSWTRQTKADYIDPVFGWTK